MSAIVEYQEPALATSPMDLPVAVFQAGLDRRKHNRDALMGWLKDALVEGSDYGCIHTVKKDNCASFKATKTCSLAAHWSKPVLFKPGAEKICGMLGVTVHFPTLQEYERAAYSGVDVRNIILRCELRDASSRIVAEGCGARSVEKDFGDLNKAIKMACKSGQIDATLRMAGLSEVFTQDLEDMHPPEPVEPILTPIPTPTQPDKVSAAQVKRLEARIHNAGLDREKVKRWLSAATKGRVSHFRDMTKAMYDKLDLKIDEWAVAQPTRQPSNRAMPASDGDKAKAYYATLDDLEKAINQAAENATEKDEDFVTSLLDKFGQYGLEMFLSPAHHDYLENLAAGQ